MKIPIHRKLMFIGSVILAVNGLLSGDAVVGGVGVICLVILSVSQDILDAIEKLKND